MAVVGGGHAGVEAALAAARLGADTVLIAMNLDSIAALPCNPSIGGSGKGQLVCEIDALGGEMGRAADSATLQMRTLGEGKGPAVRSRRAQVDRLAYRAHIRAALERQANLRLVQGEVVELKIEKDDAGVPRAAGVVLRGGGVYRARSVVLCPGTFLRARVTVGESSVSSGPDGQLPASDLSRAIERILPLRRFKTGTPPRLDGRSIDLSSLERQEEDPSALPFSPRFDGEDEPPRPRVARHLPCYIVYTSEATHEIIRRNLDRSPLYDGRISGVGPRYCPSIEDKIVRFADKPRHALFLEPMGEETSELYLGGFSTSLPVDVQLAALRTLPGFANAVVTRPGYAIEYDAVDPTALTHTWECRALPGLFFAGQICGSSGYEEAAAGGILAGANAALALLGREPLRLTRTDGYIGLLADDLTTKGAAEPYRVMTSRSEVRLLLREGNAHRRLVPIGYRAGLVCRARYEAVLRLEDEIAAEKERLEKTVLPPSPELRSFLEGKHTPPPPAGASLAALVRRPQLTYEDLAPFDKARPHISTMAAREVEIELKYEGYLARERAEVARARRLAEKPLPRNFDYTALKGLRLEAREKLCAARPATLAEAAALPGVSPADISVLMVWLRG